MWSNKHSAIARWRRNNRDRYTPLPFMFKTPGRIRVELMSRNGRREDERGPDRGLDRTLPPPARVGLVPRESDRMIGPLLNERCDDLKKTTDSRFAGVVWADKNVK